MQPIASTLVLLLGAASADAGADCRLERPAIVEGLGSAREELERAAQLTGDAPATPLLVRSGGARLAGGCGAAVRPLPLRLDAVGNSRYPSGANDRLLWAGRGLSTMLSGGAVARWRWLSAALAPEVAWQQNHAFEIVPNGRSGALAFMSPLYGDAIDLPQRFGAGPFASAGFGQSYVRADAFNVAVGFTTENLWLGPGVRNSLLMTDTAPGVPRAFLGTTRPADVWIGRLEATAFWGWLDRSRYFPDGGHPLLMGLALTFEPRWIPGLYLGGARVFVQPGTGLRLRDYFAVLQGPWKNQTVYWSGGDNPLDNQLAAAWIRWVLPESGLEIYGEWGKEDYSGWTVNQFIQDPSWTQAWILGLQKIFRAGTGRVRLLAEATHLQELRGPPNPSWYTHGNDLGYTNAGQLLGAGIGPGGDSQTLAVDWLSPSGGRIGGYVERIGRNVGAYWNAADPATYGAPRPDQDAELTVAARQLLRAGPLEVAWELGVQRRWNRDFLGNEVNLRGALRVIARFDGPTPAAEPAAPVRAAP